MYPLTDNKGPDHPNNALPPVHMANNVDFKAAAVSEVAQPMIAIQAEIAIQADNVPHYPSLVVNVDVERRMFFVAELVRKKAALLPDKQAPALPPQKKLFIDQPHHVKEFLSDFIFKGGSKVVAEIIVQYDGTYVEAKFLQRTLISHLHALGASMITCHHRLANQKAQGLPLLLDSLDQGTKQGVTLANHFYPEDDSDIRAARYLVHSLEDTRRLNYKAMGHLLVHASNFGNSSIKTGWLNLSQATERPLSTELGWRHSSIYALRQASQAFSLIYDTLNVARKGQTIVEEGEDYYINASDTFHILEYLGPENEPNSTYFAFRIASFIYSFLEKRFNHTNINNLVMHYIGNDKKTGLKQAKIPTYHPFIVPTTLNNVMCHLEKTANVKAEQLADLAIKEVTRVFSLFNKPPEFISAMKQLEVRSYLLLGGGIEAFKRAEHDPKESELFSALIATQKKLATPAPFPHPEGDYVPSLLLLPENFRPTGKKMGKNNYMRLVEQNPLASLAYESLCYDDDVHVQWRKDILKKLESELPFSLEVPENDPKMQRFLDKYSHQTFEIEVSAGNRHAIAIPTLSGLNLMQNDHKKLSLFLDELGPQLYAPQPSARKVNIRVLLRNILGQIGVFFLDPVITGTPIEKLVPMVERIINTRLAASINNLNTHYMFWAWGEINRAPAMSDDMKGEIFLKYSQLATEQLRAGKTDEQIEMIKMFAKAILPSFVAVVREKTDGPLRPVMDIVWKGVATGVTELANHVFQIIRNPSDIKETISKALLIVSRQMAGIKRELDKMGQLPSPPVKK